MKTWHDWRKLSSNANKLIHRSGEDKYAYEREAVKELKDLLQIIPEPDTHKTLDFGCGNARLLRYLPTVYGVDIVPDFIVEAQRYTDKAFLRDHLLDTDFDVVFSISVFIHLNDEDTEEALRYIHERLKPGGLAYLQILIYESHTLPRDFIDVRTWKTDTLLPLIESIGFTADELWLNPGHFSYDAIGPNHHQLQKFIKV